MGGEIEPMEVSGQEKNPVPTELEAVWVPEPNGTSRGEKNLLSLPGIEVRTLQPVT